MPRLPTAAWLVVLVSTLAWSGPQPRAGARQEPRSETAIRGAVVRIAQVVEVVAEDGARHQPTRLPSGAVVSADGITLIPSGFDAQVSPLGLVLLPTGSGTIVSREGLILTNAHVVRHGLVRSSVDEWQRNVTEQGTRYQLRVREGQYGIVKLVEPQSGAPPQLAYFAGWATDEAGAPIVGAGNRDLAVLKIDRDHFEEPFTTDEFQARDVLEPAYTSRVTDDTAIRIFGYPRGVDALLITRGGVAGREQVADLRWILTDADVGPGNSGGAAVDEAGQLIGVPTQVDCVVTETEADCPVTEEAIVKILPITAAEPLLARAGLAPTPDAMPTTGPTDTPEPPTVTLPPTETAVPPTSMPSPEPTATGTLSPSPTATATATSEPAADGAILLREDFSDPATGPFTARSWSNGGVDFAAAYEDDEWVMRGGDEGWTEVIRSSVPGGPYSDVAIEVDARLVSDEEGAFVALTCRYNPDNGDHYRLEFSPADGAYTIVRVEAGRWNGLIPWTTVDAVRRGDEWHHLGLACTGATISAVVNGVLVPAVADDRFATGDLHIFAGRFDDQPGRIDARFDNLVVYDTSAGAESILLAEGFADPATGRLTAESWTDDGVEFSTAYEDGEWAMRGGDEGWTGGIRTAIPGGPYANAAIEVDARVVGEEEGTYVGVACRYDWDSGAGYRLYVNTAEGTYAIVQTEPGEDTDLVPWTADDAIRPDEEWNHLSLNCTGATITAIINGVPVATVVDHRFTEGELVILAGRFNNRPGPFETRFDNLVVRETQGG